MRRRYLVFLFTILIMFLFMSGWIVPSENLRNQNVNNNQQILKQGSAVVATDYNVEIAADGDDCYWWYSGSWAIQTTDDHMYFLSEGNPIGWPVLRWVLNVPQGATIDDANLTVWFQHGQDEDDGEIWLIDEANVGDLESDGSMPILDTTEHADISNHGAQGFWETSSITALVQNHVDRVDFESGYYIGFMLQHNDTTTTGQIDLEDYADSDPYHAYINVSYTVVSNNAPQNSAMPTCSNADDSNNLYAQLREYRLTINVTDADGFADIDYTELSLWSNDRTTEYWRLRFDEDTATFSEQSDSSNMITLNATASTNTSSGNNLNVTFYVTVHWNHTDTTDTDAKVYVRDDETQVQYFADDCKYFSVSPNHFPHAYYYNHRTYVVWHGEGENEDDAGNPFIRYYDHGSGYWSDAVQMGTNQLTDDFHGSPNVWVDSDGYIHSLFGAHGTLTPMQHVKSDSPENITDGFSTVNNLDWNATYPTVDYVDGVIHLIYRYYDGVSQMSMVYVNSTDDGATWNTKHTFLDVDDGTGYIPYRYGAIGIDPNSENLIHFSWCVYNETTPNEYQHVYHAYLNVNNLHVYSADETDLGTTIDTSEMLTNCIVLDTGSYHAETGSVHTDENGIPYIIFASDYPSGITYTYFTYWNSTETSWETPEIICNTNRYSSVGDFIVYSSTNITAFITDVEDMTRWSWDGSSWTKEETILAVTGGRDLAFGFLVSPYGTQPQEEFQITFCEWYNGYSNKAWAWGSSGLLNDTSDDLGWYEVNYDVETRLDFEIGPAVDDALGTPDRGDIDGTALAFGTIQYFNSTSNIRPLETEIDIWISCTEYGSEVGPWEATNYADSTGYFSYIVTVDNEVGLDTYTFIAVEEDSGSDGTDLMHTTHIDTYISDRLIVDIQADDETPDNEQQVTFTLIITYEYDSTTCTTYNLTVYRNSTAWYAFTNGNKSLFNDTNSDALYNYTGYSISETTHGLTALTSNTETVTWSAIVTTTTITATTSPSIFYELFLSLNMWGYLGPLAIVVVGYVLAKKDKGLGVIAFMVQCLFVAQYLVLVSVTPEYWWHVIIILLGGIFSCVVPLMDKR